MIDQFKRLFSAPGDTPGDAPEGTPVLPLDDVEHAYCSALLSAGEPLDAPLSDFEERVLGEVGALLASPEAACEALPRLPDVLPRLMKSLRDERASWEEIAHVVGQDALLVAEVLRLANSPCFRAAARITCLEQVVMQLGLVGLREVVVTVSLKPIMQLDGGRYYRQAGRRVWSQALAAAVACRSLAMSRQASRFEAYLAGLVHNVGMVLVVQALQGLAQDGETPRSVQFRERIQPLVKRLSCLVARHWDLPALSVEALRERAEPAAGAPSPLGGILQQGIQLSMLQGLIDDGRLEDPAPYLRSLPEGDRHACEQALSEIEAHARSL